MRRSIDIVSGDLGTVDPKLFIDPDYIPSALLASVPCELLCEEFGLSWADVGHQRDRDRVRSYFDNVAGADALAYLRDGIWPEPIRWTVMLGIIPDDEVARVFGVTRESVERVRARMGIPAMCHGATPAGWGAADDGHRCI